MAGLVNLSQRLLVLILRQRQQLSFVFSGHKGKEGLQAFVLFLRKTPQVSFVVVNNSCCFWRLQTQRIQRYGAACVFFRLFTVGCVPCWWSQTLFHTFKCYQEFKSSVLFLLKASKTAQIAKDYGIEQAALTGYGQAKNGFDVANR